MTINSCATGTLITMSIEGAGGRHIIITGASSGIGEATARALSRAGHRLVLAARRKELLEALVRDINPSGKRVIGVVCDVTKAADLEALVTRARAEFGAVQVLINNAGVDSGGQKWWLADHGEVDKVMATNVTAVFNLTRLVLPEMLENRNGHIINIGSVAGRVAVGSLYGASKFALRGTTPALVIHRQASSVPHRIGHYVQELRRVLGAASIHRIDVQAPAHAVGLLAQGAERTAHSTR